MATELEGHQHLAKAKSSLGPYQRGGGTARAERSHVAEVEVGSLPEIRDDRAEDGELLVGRAAIDIDPTEETGDERLDLLGFD
jgi:hypothetical protein